MDLSSHEVTRLLIDWSNGDQSALQKLIPLVYAELHRMAKRYMSQQNPGHTLQTTALIHEAYLKLVNQEEKQWQNRAHFFAVAARAMRHILVDYARGCQSVKRGGMINKVPLNEGAVVSEEPTEELVALHDALLLLDSIDSRKSQVVELRFFGGLSVKETSLVLNVSQETVKRDWRLAKMWLLQELKK